MVPFLTEAHTALVVRVILVQIPLIPITAEEVNVVVVLEKAVIIDDPGHLWTNIRAKDGCCILGVVVGGELVA